MGLLFKVLAFFVMRRFVPGSQGVLGGLAAQQVARRFGGPQGMVMMFLAERALRRFGPQAAEMIKQRRR